MRGHGCRRVAVDEAKASTKNRVGKPTLNLYYAQPTLTHA